MRRSARFFAVIAALAVGACSVPPPGGDAAGSSGASGAANENGRQDSVSLEILERVAAAEISGRSAGRPEDWNDPRFGNSASAELAGPGQPPNVREEAVAQEADAGLVGIGETGAGGGPGLQAEALAAESAGPDGTSPEASEAAATRRDAVGISDEQDFEAVTRRESI